MRHCDLKRRREEGVVHEVYEPDEPVLICQLAVYMAASIPVALPVYSVCSLPGTGANREGPQMMDVLQEKQTD